MTDNAFGGFSKDQLLGALSGYTEKAKSFLTDREQFDNLILQVEDKVKNVPAIGNQLADLAMMISMARSYIAKEYTDVEQKTILLEIGALLYLISPVDLINDKKLLIGHLDDLAVILLVQNMCHDDIEKYRIWQAGGVNLD